MHARVMLSGLLLFVFVTDASAQNRFRWRPGMLLEGLADTVQVVARDIDQRITTEPTEDRDAGDRAEHAESGHHQHSRRPSPIRSHPIQPATRAVTIDDVITMVRRGLGESTIIHYIDDNGVQRRLDVNDLILLHDEGVSDPIINAMQTARVLVPEQTPPQVTPPKVQQRQSSSRYRRSSRQTVDVEQLGPSILLPPQNAGTQTP